MMEAQISNPTGDALAANEEVMRQAALAILKDGGFIVDEFSLKIALGYARAAISAYLKAMEEPSVLSSPRND